MKTMKNVTETLAIICVILGAISTLYITFTFEGILIVRILIFLSGAFLTIASSAIFFSLSTIISFLLNKFGDEDMAKIDLNLVRNDGTSKTLNTSPAYTKKKQTWLESMFSLKY